MSNSTSNDNGALEVKSAVNKESQGYVAYLLECGHTNKQFLLVLLAFFHKFIRSIDFTSSTPETSNIMHITLMQDI